MKNLILILILSICYSCSMDNKVYPLKFESITKKDNNYLLTVSTDVNLDEIKDKHQFTHQDFIGELKNRDFRDQSIIVTGNFDTKNQKNSGNRFYYIVEMMITDREKQQDLTRLLTKKDTINGFLQLSYETGRTYPTKSIEIPAEKIIQLR